MLTHRTRSVLHSVATILAAAALDSAHAEGVNSLTEVVVTGSFIEGTVETAALPVTVIDSDELQKQGSPSIIEIMRSLPASQGIVGEVAAQSIFEGTGSVSANLRGLEGGRTLVLFNGKRLPVSPVPLLGVDLNLLPLSAVERIEVLKDGAAATYGSDAVAGVVNFISKRGFEGFDLDASYTAIRSTDGDYSASATWGHKGDDFDLLVSGGYRHRSRLKAIDRDFPFPSYDPTAGIGGFSAAGNPGAFVIPGPGPIPNVVLDPACERLGGFRLGGVISQCQLRFAQYQNLVEREDDYGVYAEYNSRIGGDVELHLEGFYTAHDIPEESASPSFPATQGPGATTQRQLGLPVDPANAPTFIVPLTNQGLASLLPSLTSAQQTSIQGVGFVALNGLLGRPIGVAGNPLYDNEGAKRERLFDSLRFAVDLKGQFAFANWSVSGSYGESTKHVRAPLILPARYQLALFGLGGSRCAGNTPGVNGCLFFNPFSTGVAANRITGQVNPVLSAGGTFDANTVNSLEVIDYLFEDRITDEVSDVWVVDALLNGESGVRLPGGTVSWAVGAQYRRDGLQRTSNPLSNLAITPCPDSVINPTASCASPVGPFDFQTGQTDLDVDADVYGVYTEANVPVLEALQAQVAFRYEDYGGVTGSTSNPKLALRYQATDWLSFRASASSTFRGPPLIQAFTPPITALQFVPLFSSVRPFDFFGNPNLKPEDGQNLNLGVLIDAGEFSMTLDYFDIRLHDKILPETGLDVFTAFFGTPQRPQNNCGRAGYETLQARFTFQGGVCGPNSLLRTRVNIINGPDERTNGLDLSASYDIRNVMQGSLLLGVDATYNLEYTRDPFFIEGILVPTAGGRDFIGTRGGIQTLPELHGAAFVQYSNAMHNLRVTGHYVDGVTDLQETARDADGQLDEVASYWTADVTYRLSLANDLFVGASVFNVADRDPPRAKFLDYNYDPFFANPVGRAFKVSVSKRFE
jgi:iron complex outermembrane recepter protein